MHTNITSPREAPNEYVGNTTMQTERPQLPPKRSHNITKKRSTKISEILTIEEMFQSPVEQRKRGLILMNKQEFKGRPIQGKMFGETAYPGTGGQCATEVERVHLHPSLSGIRRVNSSRLEWPRGFAMELNCAKTQRAPLQGGFFALD